MAATERFEYVFLGGGKGGKILAMELATAGKRVAVVERGMIGGSCINVACIPTKALIHSARVVHAAAESRNFGVPADTSEVDMLGVQRHVRKVVDDMVDVNFNAFRASGLELVLGNGRFVAPRTLEVSLVEGGTRVIEGEHVFINTGTHAAIPPVPGLADARPMTHVEALRLERRPKHLIVIGGGYVGLEMAQAFRRLGSRVTLLQDGPRIASREDHDVTDAIEAAFAQEGIEIHTSIKIREVTGASGDRVNVALADGTVITATDILVAAGRTLNTREIGLDLAGVEADARGFLKVDERLATTAPNTWAIGEVAGTPMFTHASWDDYRVLRSQLNDGDRTTKGRLVPYAMFIEPELGRVGLNEIEAAALGIEVRVAKIPMAVVPRARTIADTRGFMKALVAKDTDEILGFTMLGSNAGEVAAVVQMAMLGKLPYTAVRDAIIAHPTISEGLNLLFGKVPARTV